MDIGNILEVANSKDWRAWLAKHHQTETEIWLVFYKKGSGKPRISYNQAVMEALSYGWIDSTVKYLDSERFVQRFSKRKKTSGLSQMNKERIRTLIRQKKMTKAGLAAVAHVFDPEKDNAEAFIIPPDILQALQENKQAWTNFQQFPEAYKRIRVAYIASRKRHSQEQFQTSLKHFVQMTARNKRIGFVKEMK
jgi:uncharacterized protein YdeI (YjbR/CyaY-like superfamily)